MRTTERLSVNERRKRIMEILSARRSVTAIKLAEEFDTSVRTINRDLESLSLEYPITAKRGHDGCYSVPDGWYISRSYLTTEQKKLLTKLKGQLSGEDKMLMDSILARFSMPEC